MKNIADLSKDAQLAFRLVVDNPGNEGLYLSFNFAILKIQYGGQPIKINDKCDLSNVANHKEIETELYNAKSALEELINMGLIHHRKLELPESINPNSINYKEGYFPTPLVWRN